MAVSHHKYWKVVFTIVSCNKLVKLNLPEWSVLVMVVVEWSNHLSQSKDILTQQKARSSPLNYFSSLWVFRDNTNDRISCVLTIHDFQSRMYETSLFKAFQLPRFFSQNSTDKALFKRFQKFQWQVRCPANLKILHSKTYIFDVWRSPCQTFKLSWF